MSARPQQVSRLEAWARHASVLGCVLLILVMALPFRTDSIGPDAMPWTIQGKPYSDSVAQRICDSQPGRCPGAAVLVSWAGPLLAAAAVLAIVAAFGFARGWNGHAAPLFATAATCLATTGAAFLDVGIRSMFGFWMLDGFMLPHYGAGAYAMVAAIGLFVVAVATGFRAKAVLNGSVQWASP